MAARSRPRGGPLKDDDAHEERNMWSQIQSDFKRLKNIQAKAIELARLIVEAEAKYGASATATPNERVESLQNLYKDSLQLGEEEQKILYDDHDSVGGVVQNISLLCALRSASENEQQPGSLLHQRAPLPLMKSSRATNKRKFDAANADGGGIGIDSPVGRQSPNPAAASSHSGLGHTRLMKERGGSGASSGSGGGGGGGYGGGRSGSVPYMPKDGGGGGGAAAAAAGAATTTMTGAKADEFAAGTDGVGGGRGAAAEKAGLLVKDAEVAYKLNRFKNAEGDWIQCIIISVSGEGKNKRYEVQDPEPDEHGKPGQVYKTYASSLVPIPPPGAPLPDFPRGKQVLARYPDTTTFYRAEVMGMRRDTYRLKFEGEEEIGKEMDVDRRYVLDLGGK